MQSAFANLVSIAATPPTAVALHYGSCFIAFVVCSPKKLRQLMYGQARVVLRGDRVAHCNGR